MNKEYNPKRIERTIRRYRNDQANIAEQINDNRSDISEMESAIDLAKRRIMDLKTQNMNLNREHQIIEGKISGLEMVLKDELPDED